MESVPFTAELSFLETSALTGENVEEVFLKCARSILTKIDAGLSGGCGRNSLRIPHNIIYIFILVSKVNWTQTEWDPEYSMEMRD